MVSIDHVILRLKEQGIQVNKVLSRTELIKRIIIPIQKDHIIKVDYYESGNT